MQDASNDSTRKKEPENIKKTKYRELAYVSVTVDGPWQRRGHCSIVGVVNVIFVRTGEILDYALETLYCHECIKHNKDDKDTKVYQKWIHAFITMQYQPYQ